MKTPTLLDALNALAALEAQQTPTQRDAKKVAKAQAHLDAALDRVLKP